MDSKARIYSKRALLDSITIYIHFVKGHLDPRNIRLIVKKLMPVRNTIIESIKKNSNVVLDRYQTGELLICLIISKKVAKDRRSKMILNKTISNVQHCFIRSSDFPDEAKRDIERLRDQLKL